MIDSKKLQKKLGVKADGIIGPATLTALFLQFGASETIAAGLAKGANTAFRTYSIMDNGLRLAHFIGQTAHESGHYRHMKELGGPSYFKRYEGRKDLGNIYPGDGVKYHGRSILQLTGRANYKEFGEALGYDFIENPELVEQPDIGLLVACHFWSKRKLNVHADADDIKTLTKRINGGQNGLADRRKLTDKAKALIL